MPRFVEEALYQEALEIALKDAGIPFVAQKAISPVFHGKVLTHSYKPDIICYDKIIIELKAVRQLLPEHYAQLRNYLGLLGMKVGLLVNFHGHPTVSIRRIFLPDKNNIGVIEDLETGAVSPLNIHADKSSGRIGV